MKKGFFAAFIFILIICSALLLASCKDETVDPSNDTKENDTSDQEQAVPISTEGLIFEEYEDG